MVGLTQSKWWVQDRGELGLRGEKMISLASCLHDPCQPVSAPLNCPIPTAEVSFAAPLSKG